MIELHEITALSDLMTWRREVLRNVFSLEPSADLLAENQRYYKEHTANGSHYAIVAQFDGTDAGCGGICFTDELPSPDNPSGKCGYLMNIFVRQPFRRQGVAHEIIKRLVAEAKARNCGKIYLETTATGRPVYESLGFKNLPDIMKLS